uniref:Ig-like domain-containing protein n=1 Tax=Paramormyrops kingsleyae TaxID=1676925 RepID=A0A3B3Q4K7_9TELE
MHSIPGVLLHSSTLISTECRAVDSVNQTAGDVFASEGGSVTLNCTYEISSSADEYLFYHDITNFRSMYWYVQHPNKAPELLIQGYDKAVSKGRFLMDVNRKDALTNLSISDSRTEDTAVYYCAVQPTVTQCVCLMLHLIFGCCFAVLCLHDFDL